MNVSTNDLSKLHKNESIKFDSRYLRGTLAEDIANPITGAISADNTQLTKFHGIYQQDDRDVRPERRKKKLEPAYSFMARVRVPGGVCTPRQWLQLDRISDERANGTLRITTRQAFQFHGIIKSNLKPALRAINDGLLDTIAACGDVNRNVMSNPNPFQSEHHAEVLELADSISSHLLPRTRAYHELWLEDQRVDGAEPLLTEEEPIYGRTYLPRKFKIVIAVPPSNDVDIYAHDLGFIAIIEKGKIVGYNVTVGGGHGMTHGKEETYPRCADVMGFCTPEQAVEVAEKVVIVQRDFGDRTDRAHARLKYTIDDRGIDWFRTEVEKRLGYEFGKPRPFSFTSRGDRYGWITGTDGKEHYTLFIQNGRVKDTAECQLKSGLREIARIHTGDFRLTANQNLIIGSVAPEKKELIEEILRNHKIGGQATLSAMRLNSIACVALPTCGLALAESERYLPDLVSELENVLEECGLRDDEIVIRMTGCPNGCARPYLAEIGLVGKGPRTYNLYLGAAFTGERLNKLYRADVKDNEIVPLLRPILQDYAKNRHEGERFGDFVIRHNHIRATREGKDFHHEAGKPT
jgi:sulfite reductase (NADPH) hemoprotein beta-component